MIRSMVVASMFTLAGCHQAKLVPPQPTVVIVGCEHFHLISASRRDTPETREQILAHNAEYLKVCPAAK